MFFCCFLFERNAIFFSSKNGEYGACASFYFILFFSMSFSLSLSLLQSDRRLSVQYTILLLKILGTLVKLVPHTRLWRAKRRIASSQFIMIRSHSAISLEYHLNYGWKQTHRCGNGMAERMRLSCKWCCINTCMYLWSIGHLYFYVIIPLFSLVCSFVWLVGWFSSFPMYATES